MNEWGSGSSAIGSTYVNELADNDYELDKQFEAGAVSEYEGNYFLANNNLVPMKADAEKPVPKRDIGMINSFLDMIEGGPNLFDSWKGQSMSEETPEKGENYYKGLKSLFGAYKDYENIDDSPYRGRTSSRYQTPDIPDWREFVKY